MKNCRPLVLRMLAVVMVFAIMLLSSCSGGETAASSGTSSAQSDKKGDESKGEETYERVRVEHTSPAKMRALVISDTHNQNAIVSNAIAKTWAYAQTQEYKGFDAVVIVGDLTDNGTREELTNFKNAYDSAVAATGQDIQLITCMGNHEFGNKTHSAEENKEYVALFEEIIGHPATNAFEVNGYKFLSMSPTNHAGDYTEAAVWLMEQLKSNDGQKPLFVMQHYPLGNTVFQSGDGDNTSLIAQALTKHGNVIDMSGHSHAPVTNLRSLYQLSGSAYTVFNCGSFSNTNAFIDDTQGSGYYRSQQFSIFEVYDDNVVDVKLYDLVTDKFLDTSYQVGKGIDNSVDYLRKATDAPEFASGAKANIDSVGPTAVQVSFPQATDDDGVEMYRVDVLDSSGKSVSSVNTTSYYFKTTDRPDSLYQAVSGLKEKTEYTATVTAIDFYGNESKPLSTDKFTTGSYPSGISPVVEGSLFSTKANWVGATGNIDETKGYYISSQGAGHYIAYNNTFDLGTKWMASVDYYRATYNLTDDNKSYSAMQVGPLTLGVKRGSQCDYLCLSYNYNGEQPSGSAFDDRYLIAKAELTSCLEQTNTLTMTYENGTVKVYRDGSLAISITPDQLKAKTGSLPGFASSKIVLRLNDLWVVNKMGATFDNVVIKK